AATHDAAVLDQAAEADSRSRRDVLFNHVARRVEEHDRIAQRAEDEGDRNGQHADGAAYQNEASLFACHDRCSTRAPPSGERVADAVPAGRDASWRGNGRAIAVAIIRNRVSPRDQTS